MSKEKLNLINEILLESDCIKYAWESKRKEEQKEQDRKNRKNSMLLVKSHAYNHRFTNVYYVESMKHDYDFESYDYAMYLNTVGCFVIYPTNESIIRNNSECFMVVNETKAEKDLKDYVKWSKSRPHNHVESACNIEHLPLIKDAAPFPKVDSLPNFEYKSKLGYLHNFDNIGENFDILSYYNYLNTKKSLIINQDSNDLVIDRNDSLSIYKASFIISKCALLKRYGHNVNSLSWDMYKSIQRQLNDIMVQFYIPYGDSFAYRYRQFHYVYDLFGVKHRVDIPDYIKEESKEHKVYNDMLIKFSHNVYNDCMDLVHEVCIEIIKVIDNYGSDRIYMSDLISLNPFKAINAFMYRMKSQEKNIVDLVVYKTNKDGSHSEKFVSPYTYDESLEMIDTQLVVKSIAKIISNNLPKRMDRQLCFNIIHLLAMGYNKADIIRILKSNKMTVNRYIKAIEKHGIQFGIDTILQEFAYKTVEKGFYVE